MKTFTKKVSLKTGYFSLLLMTIVFLGFSITDSNAQACPLACNDNVQISLDTNCIAVITPDIVLEDPGIGCAYVVEVYDKFGNVIPNATITKEFVGQTLNVAVFLGTNSCWGLLTVEDKYPPQVICPDADTVWCHEFPGPDKYIWPTATVYDSCGPVTKVIVSTEFENWECTDGSTTVLNYSGIWKQKCYWVDQSGNKSDTCIVEVYLRRAKSSDIVFPADKVILCTDYQKDKSLTEPANAGLPTINGSPLYFPNGNNRYYACEMNITYTDDTIDVCPGSFKILRKWISVDWCYPSGTDPLNPREVFQIIKVADNGLQVSAPAVCPPTNLNGNLDEIAKYSDLIGMNYWSCNSTKFLLPNPMTDPRFLVEACSDVTYTVGVRVARDPEVCDGPTYPEVVQPYIQEKIVNGEKVFYAIELPAGYNWIVYHFEDGCGNVQESKYDVYVYDDIPPTPVCDEHTIVSLNVDGLGKVYAESLDDGSSDNCKIDYFEVRRMTDNCNIKGNTKFGPFVEFCCEDLGTGPHLVELKVVDERGNKNTCMVEVDVQDKLRPTVICPPDATVSCDYDLSDLSIFGTIRNKRNNETRERLVAASDRSVIWDVKSVDRIDGYYYDNDNCNVKFKVKETFVEYNCQANVGYVKRVFTVTDKSGNSTSCTQTITLKQSRRFVMDNRLWNKLVPDYTDDKGCADYDQMAPDENQPWGKITPFNASQGKPGCYQLAVRFEDQVFTLGSDACIKIIRKWTVIDWCQFDRDNVCGDKGIWCHTQILKVIDNTPPEFTCKDVIITPLDEYNCQRDNYSARRRVQLDASSSDNCAKDKLKWDFTIERKEEGGVCRPGSHDGSGNWIIFGKGKANSINGFFPFGEYRITWSVVDQCGNVSTCKNHYFDVLDEKQPTPYCRNGINTVVMPSSGTISVWAKDFDIGSYDNCPEDTRISFQLELLDNAGNPYSPPRLSKVNGDMIFDCSLIGPQNLRMWVIDECGNKDYCTVILDIQDPNGACGNNVTVGIGGAVKDVNGNIIPRVRVNLDMSSVNSSAYRVTSAAGTYAFNGLAKDNNYVVRPTKNDDPSNGVSTRDLVYIQKHLLGYNEFTNVYKYIASDANNDTDVTTADISELRKLILGKIDGFRNGQESWRFYDQAYVYDDPQDPFPFPESISYNDMSNNNLSTDFVGVKIGDLNLDVDLNLDGQINTRSEALAMNVQDVQFEENEIVDVVFEMPSEGMIEGYQFTMTFDPEMLQLVDVIDGAVSLEDDNFNYEMLSEGIITTSWFNVDGVEMNENEQLFTIQFRAHSNGRISEAINMNSDITKAEIYMVNQATADLDLRFGTSEEGIFELYQNRPNPFADATVIGFSLPEEGDATLTIYNINGKVIKVIEGTYPKGYNEINIDKNELSSSGVLYYQLDAQDFTSTRKMVLIK